MDPDKSLDKYKLIAALTHDVMTKIRNAEYSDVLSGPYLTHVGVDINTKQVRLSLQKLRARLASEGDAFLTKALPRLGKAFDRALCEGTLMNVTELGFKTQPGTNLPMLFGEFFIHVFSQDGQILQDPCVHCIKSIRQLLYLFYKYELPYTDEQEHEVIQRFVRTEEELDRWSLRLSDRNRELSDYLTASSYRRSNETNFVISQEEALRRAKALLAEVFAWFDPKDIHPRHGPGVVATKQAPWDKFRWTNISAKITRVYPMDAYFFASLGHICDQYKHFGAITDRDLPARVCLVPKDSRGPRLISCEPVDYQWIQQGLAKAIVHHVENHPLTREHVFFTDQVPNRIGALLGSSTGKYATLDLNEASDRVSLELVRLLFPPHIYEFLESARSSSTQLPDGTILPLWKYAPMGSALCFPVMALSIWAILTAAATDADVREHIHVYGDDVIVPTAFADDAIKQLESYGLKTNPDKCCIKGFFRESCGIDAYKGISVTPVRLRTVWSSSPSPEAYTSWIAYANSFYDRCLFGAYDYIVGLLHAVYGAIPDRSMNVSAPCLAEVSEDKRPKRRRINSSLQKCEWKVRVVKSPSVHRFIDGWSMLLRYFSERTADSLLKREEVTNSLPSYDGPELPTLSSYTRRHTSMLVWRWR